MGEKDFALNCVVGMPAATSAGVPAWSRLAPPGAVKLQAGPAEISLAGGAGGPGGRAGWAGRVSTTLSTRGETARLGGACVQQSPLFSPTPVTHGTQP